MKNLSFVDKIRNYIQIGTLCFLIGYKRAKFIHSICDSIRAGRKKFFPAAEAIACTDSHKTEHFSTEYIVFSVADHDCLRRHLYFATFDCISYHIRFFGSAFGKSVSRKKIKIFVYIEMFKYPL